MSQLYLRTIAVLVAIVLFNTSCEQDRYEEPELNPSIYNFNFPNKLTFNYSQVFQKRESVIPYTNTLRIKNISNDSQSVEFVIFSFKDDLLNYDNINFIKHSSESIEIGNTTEPIALAQTNTLFTNNNTITSLLNSNNSQNHIFNGLYRGELNVYDDSDEFQRTLLCTGFIDYQGKFYFFIENENENDIVRLEGSFNSQNTISGTIFNREAVTLASISNDSEVDFSLTNMNLTGDINYTNNAQQHLLQFNLTKQN
ncbi:MAG: hypothetical protein AAF611_06270 [Bacteroidota bacterium]